jgi:hypothetical protein
MTPRRTLLTALAALWGCSDPAPAAPADAAVVADADAADAPVDAPAVSPAATCASAFGTALPAGYGRLDGVVRAVVTPADTQCAMPNGTHVVVQVASGGAVYRMVVNVASTAAGVDPRVRFAEVAHALPGPDWAEGFHADQQFDYAATLGLHADAAPFAPATSAELVARLAASVRVGARVSVYAQGDGGSSAHLVHRNGRDDDGAVVLDPTGSPRFLVFHFDGQSF